MQCKEWDDANSELFKESHDEAVHKISYESRLYELISASLASCTEILHFVQNDGPGRKAPQRVVSFPAPMTPMQHRLPVISSGGQRKNDEIVS